MAERSLLTCYQIKPPVPGMGYLFLSCWPVGPIDSPSLTLQAIANATGYSPKLDQPIAEDTTYLWGRTWGISRWYLTGSFLLNTFLVLEVLYTLPEEKHSSWSCHSMNPASHNNDLSGKISPLLQGTKCYGSNQLLFKNWL